MDFSNTIDATNAASITVNQMLHQTHAEVRQPDTPIHARQTDGDKYAAGLAVLFAVSFVGLIAWLNTRAYQPRLNFPARPPKILSIMDHGGKRWTRSCSTTYR